MSKACVWPVLVQAKEIAESVFQGIIWTKPALVCPVPLIVRYVRTNSYATAAQSASIRCISWKTEWYSLIAVPQFP